MTKPRDKSLPAAPVPFPEAFDAATATDVELHLLTGNGASIALWPRFTYPSLIAAMIDRGLDPEVVSNLAADGITDLESILRELTSENWRSIDDALDLRSTDPRSFFANVIAEIHPHNPSEICQHALAAGGRFFHRFSSVSTTNHDLLLYWAHMEVLGEYDFRRRLGDGFRPYRGGNPLLTDRLIFNRQTATGTRIVRYLHGAFHLSSADGNTIKYHHTPKRGPVMHQARTAILGGYLPLIVSGGDSSAKVRLINRDEYLYWAHESFRRISGALFVHGFGFNETDHHILDAIGDNFDLSHLYVGVFSEAPESERDAVTQAAVRLRDKRASTANPLSVTLYQSETAPIWNPGASVATAELNKPTCDRCSAAGCILDANTLQ